MKQNPDYQKEGFDAIFQFHFRLGGGGRSVNYCNGRQQEI